jgi:hypothetical protein
MRRARPAQPRLLDSLSNAGRDLCSEPDPRQAALDQLLFDSFVEASGDALRRLRHNPNNWREALTCPEMIRRESVNPKVQGAIPCASTIEQQLTIVRSRGNIADVP